MINALEIRGLEKTYANGFRALKGIDLHVPNGDFLALLGPNGAGKSTTIGIISSLVRKSAGTVSVFGVDLDQDPQKAKSLLGIVPQELNFSMFETCLDILVHQAGYYGIRRRVALERAERYLMQLGLWEKRNDQSRTLSGGLKRRLMIARALVHEPQMLILDEPTAGVDVELRRSMWSFLLDINNRGTTIVLTTHYLEEAESLCRNIAIIDKGQIIESTSMKSLLAKLNTHTFIMDLDRPYDSLPLVHGYSLHAIDPTTVEVELTKEQDMNELFLKLTESNVRIRSMRNKSNRLEELFIRLVESNKLN
ncbi:MAG: ABC transporter ATP-binding protein [Gammaproteobacteria bacterium]|nr:ABC transporter ATP-binding protein [Gammaproteobacteria bacterium]